MVDGDRCSNGRFGPAGCGCCAKNADADSNKTHFTKVWAIFPRFYMQGRNRCIVWIKLIDSARFFRPYECRQLKQQTGGFMIVENTNQLKASAEFTQTVISLLANGRGVHAETAISAAARMAGTFVLRSCRLPVSNFKPGTPIYSDLIDEEGQKVLGTVGDTLSGLKVRLDHE